MTKTIGNLQENSIPTRVIRHELGRVRGTFTF